MRPLRFSAALFVCLAFTGQAWLIAGLVSETNDETPAATAERGEGEAGTLQQQFDAQRERMRLLRNRIEQSPLAGKPSTEMLLHRLDILEGQLDERQRQWSSMSGELIPSDSRAFPMPNMLEPETPEEFRARAARRGWQPLEINGLTFYIMPLAEARDKFGQQVIAAPLNLATPAGSSPFVSGSELRRVAAPAER